MSIKLQLSKHRRTVPFKFSRSEHLLRVQQLADLAASTETLAEQGLILSAILEIIFNISLGKLFNIFPISKSLNIVLQHMTLRIMMKLKSCLKTTKALKLVEDFTEEAPDVTLASVMTTVVMLISFLFREEAIFKLRTNLRMHLRRFMGLGFTSIKKMKLLL